jgi:hypothetical protein
MKTEEIVPSGYSSELHYIHQRNREQIEARRQRLNAARAERERRAKQELHWMKCPKCGQDLEECRIEGVVMEQCTECHGVYFDRAEFEILLENRHPSSFWKRLTARVRT